MIRIAKSTKQQANTLLQLSASRGFTLLETLVAASLTITLLAVSAPMIVRSARTWQETRHHQFAADELSAHMDRLLSLSRSERTNALENILLDDEVKDVLVDAVMTSQWIDDPDGQRIVLSINWRRVGDPPPITLTAWVDSLPTVDRRKAATETETTSDQPQKEDSE